MKPAVGINCFWPLNQVAGSNLHLRLAGTDISCRFPQILLLHYPPAAPPTPQSAGLAGIMAVYRNSAGFN